MDSQKGGSMGQKGSTMQKNNMQNDNMKKGNMHNDTMQKGSTNTMSK
jgi:hypothetical protein